MALLTSLTSCLEDLLGSTRKFVTDYFSLDLGLFYYRAEWVNAVVKRRLAKRFARGTQDVEDEEDFHRLLREELNLISRDLKNSRLFYANVDELLKASV